MVKAAIDLGYEYLAITDSHSTAQLRNMRFGIDQARRGWIEAADVINTLARLLAI